MRNQDEYEYEYDPRRDGRARRAEYDGRRPPRRKKRRRVPFWTLPVILALLGALGEGDIGRHFPDSDDRYKGISSMLLLDHVMEIVRAHDMRVANADVTIVAQKPKLAAYIPQMRENIARALGVDVFCANVKATTTEHMGFEGEEIGISAQAVALLARR